MISNVYRRSDGLHVHQDMVQVGGLVVPGYVAGNQQLVQLADTSREELVTLYAQHSDRRSELDGTGAPSLDH
ncbi:MAG: hypothetical protein GF320_00905 [Armatimonadia bacterium]|nr:hypothetical protein [Armatimonadia bacterium]